MKRRDSLKYLLVGTIGGAGIVSASGCKIDSSKDADIAFQNEKLYGRTPSEIEHDKIVDGAIYLNDYELATIAVLCDIILPATTTASSAIEAEVPAFIDFIVKDLPAHQLPMRGGLMWLDGESNRRFNKQFIACTQKEEIQIIEDIAYPDPGNTKSDMTHGIKFFDLVRNLIVTGYYTTQIGFKDLGVTSNFANIWDGVPADVLSDHDVDYEAEWLAKCIDQSKRNDIAEWDKNGNLLT